MKSLDYFIGNLVIIFSIIPYVYVAGTISNIAQLGSATQKMGVWYWVAMALGIVVCIVIAVLISYYSR